MSKRKNTQVVEDVEIVEGVEENAVEEIEKEPEKTVMTCKVVVYSPERKYAVILFEGMHLTIPDVEENPGETLEVEYVGELYTPEFQIYVKK